MPLGKIFLRYIWIYCWSVVFYAGLYWLLFEMNLHYNTYFSEATRSTFWSLLWGWGICAAVLYPVAIWRDLSYKPAGYATLLALRSVLRVIRQCTRVSPNETSEQRSRVTLSFKEKTLALKLGVKVFFAPLMIEFFWGNTADMLQNLIGIHTSGKRYDEVFWDMSAQEQLWLILVEIPQQMGLLLMDLLGMSEKTHLLYEALSSVNSFLGDGGVGWFLLLFQLFVMVDVFIFGLAYLFESPILKNEIKSVEPTLLGWMAALLCYPVFNDVTDAYLDWYANESGSTFSNVVTDPSTLVLLDGSMKWAIIILFGVYLWATLSLGLKSGNLVNRGIVTRGAYRWVRHPAYFSKTLAWCISALPVLTLQVMELWQQLVYWGQEGGANYVTGNIGYHFTILCAMVFSLAGWATIYYIRAVTEEKHLISDPEYREYMKKVRYRFIPGIW